MNPLDLLTLGGKLLDKVLPDKTAADAAKAALIKQEMDGELDDLHQYAANALQQIEVSKLDAVSGDRFSARARPLVVYCSCTALLFVYIVQPLLAWLWPSHAMPACDVSVFRDLIFGVLGIYTTGRSAEKIAAIVKP